MGDVQNLDQRLRDALQEAARPVDSVGVADAIRARMETGDSGVVVSTETAPGWGGSGALGWLPWIGIVVAAAIVGGTLGATGLAGGRADVPPPQGLEVLVPRSVDARACVDGPVVATLAIDTRVLAVQRSDDAGWAGVRSPSSLADTVWVPVPVLVIDAGQPAIDELPIGGACPLVEAFEPTAAPEPSDDPVEPGPAPDPGPNPNPNPDPEPVPPPGDTTPPTVQQFGVDVNGCPAVIQAVAADNTGVTQVTLSWSGVASGSAAMTLVSGTWRYLYDSENLPEGNMTFTAIARDAAGNTSAPAVANVYMVCVS